MLIHRVIKVDPGVNDWIDMQNKTGTYDQQELSYPENFFRSARENCLGNCLYQKIEKELYGDLLREPERKQFAAPRHPFSQNQSPSRD
jgi:RNA-binding protein YlmH